MRIKKRLPLVFGVLAVLAILVIAVILRKHAPPEPARLLPSADGFVYVNVGWLRRGSFTGDLPPVSHDPEYDQFIAATGFEFERDLDTAALAIHYPATIDPKAASGDASAPARFTEVLTGRIDGGRVSAYLRKQSSQVDVYNSTDIYNIPLEGRTLRVALLGVDTVAASNHPDPQVIRGIIDRSRKLASPFGGPSLLRQYFKHVPLASLGWGIFRADAPSSVSTSSALASPLNWSFIFDKPAVVVASVRYLGSLHLRAVAYTESDADAAHVAGQLEAFLNIFRSAEISLGASGPDPDVKALFDSLQVEQRGSRAELSANLPPPLLRKLVAEAPSSVVAPPVTPAPASPTVSKPKR